MAFKIAGSMAFKEAMRKADPVLLEPIMKVCVIVPEEYMGRRYRSLNSRRGMILGMDALPGGQRINSECPAFRNVRLRYRHALQNAGKRPVYNGARALCGGSEVCFESIISNAAKRANNFKMHT